MGSQTTEEYSGVAKRYMEYDEAGCRAIEMKEDAKDFASFAANVRCA